MAKGGGARYSIEDLNKIEYLNRYLELDDEIDRLATAQKQSEARLYVVSPRISDMPRGGGEQPASKIEHSLEQLRSIERKRWRKIWELERLKDEIEQIIDRLPTRKYRRIMKLRYLKDMCFPEIADRLRYSESHIRRLHKEAVNQVILPKDERK